MSDRVVVKERYVVEGRPYEVSLIHNPIIDDVVVTEAQIHAASIQNGDDLSGRRVEREIRDFFIRLGVER